MARGADRTSSHFGVIFAPAGRPRPGIYVIFWCLAQTRYGKCVERRVVAGNLHVVERQPAPGTYGTLTSVPKRGCHQEQRRRIADVTAPERRSGASRFGRDHWGRPRPKTRRNHGESRRLTAAAGGLRQVGWSSRPAS